MNVFNKYERRRFVFGFKVWLENWMFGEYCFGCRKKKTHIRCRVYVGDMYRHFTACPDCQDKHRRLLNADRAASDLDSVFQRLKKGL